MVEKIVGWGMFKLTINPIGKTIRNVVNVISGQGNVDWDDQIDTENKPIGK